MESPLKKTRSWPSPSRMPRAIGTRSRHPPSHLKSPGPSTAHCFRGCDCRHEHHRRRRHQHPTACLLAAGGVDARCKRTNTLVLGPNGSNGSNGSNGVTASASASSSDPAFSLAFAHALALSGLVLSSPGLSLGLGIPLTSTAALLRVFQSYEQREQVCRIELGSLRSGVGDVAGQIFSDVGILSKISKVFTSTNTTR